MGYIANALDPQSRAKPEYLPKSGAMDSATVKIDPLGRVIAILGTTPQGQGHQTIVSQIVASERWAELRDVTVEDEMDTFTRAWSITSGTYSSRFGSVGTSAVALAARKLKSKLTEYAAHLMGVTPAEVEFRDGGVHRTSGKAAPYSIKDLAGRAHWNTESLPEGMEPALSATAVFGFTVAKAVDAEDRVNSSNTYGFIAEVMAVEVDSETAAITILRYVTVHDAGTIINPMIAEGQIYGGALHGLGGALYEELVYAEDGQLLTGGRRLMPLLNFRRSRPPALVDLNRIPSLAYIEEHDGQVRFGAMTRQRMIEFSPLVARRLPLLREATKWVGHLPIRTRGTIGGSIAHADPSAAYPTVLTAPDGEVVARGPEGERVVKAKDLFVTYLTTSLEPDEILVE